MLTATHLWPVIARSATQITFWNQIKLQSKAISNSPAQSQKHCFDCAWNHGIASRIPNRTSRDTVVTSRDTAPRNSTLQTIEYQHDRLQRQLLKEDHQNCGLSHKVSKVAWQFLSNLLAATHLWPVIARSATQVEIWKLSFLQSKANPNSSAQCQKRLFWLCLKSWDCHTKQFNSANHLINRRLVRNDN